MIAKSLIAAAALATTMAVALPATQAEARTNIDISIGLGMGGFYPGYYPGYAGGYYPAPVYQPNYVTCWKGGKIVDWSGFNSVKPIDCTLPGYRYTAWRNGHKFVVSVNRYGNITNVNRIF